MNLIARVNVNGAHGQIWTADLSLTKGVLYPWATWAEFYSIWSGWRESNPRYKLGRLLFYHWTTPAFTVIIVLIFLNNNDWRFPSIEWWWREKDSNLRSFRNRFTVCPLWPLGNPSVKNRQLYESILLSSSISLFYCVVFCFYCKKYFFRLPEYVYGNLIKIEHRVSLFHFSGCLNNNFCNSSYILLIQCYTLRLWRLPEIFFIGNQYNEMDRHSTNCPNPCRHAPWN